MTETLIRKLEGKLMEDGGVTKHAWNAAILKAIDIVKDHALNEIPVISNKDLRKRVMSAIRSYGYDTQSKATLESRTDGVMIVLDEYVLPFLQREPKRESSEVLQEQVTLKEGVGK